jgi:hypothetical protein
LKLFSFGIEIEVPWENMVQRMCKVAKTFYNIESLQTGLTIRFPNGQQTFGQMFENCKKPIILNQITLCHFLSQSFHKGVMHLTAKSLIFINTKKKTY